MKSRFIIAVLALVISTAVVLSPSAWAVETLQPTVNIDMQLPEGQHFDPLTSWKPMGNQLAMVYSRSILAPRDLPGYIAAIDLTNSQVQLIDIKVPYERRFRTIWPSPDGTSMVVFGDYGLRRCWFAPSNGNSTWRLETYSQPQSASFTPDGKNVVVMDSEGNLYWCARDTGDIIEVRKGLNGNSQGFFYTPTRDKVLHLSDGKLYSLNSEDYKDTRVKFDAVDMSGAPHWNSTGDRFVMRSYNSHQRVGGVWIYKNDGKLVYSMVPVNAPFDNVIASDEIGCYFAGQRSKPIVGRTPKDVDTASSFGKTSIKRLEPNVWLVDWDGKERWVQNYKQESGPGMVLGVVNLNNQVFLMRNVEGYSDKPFTMVLIPLGRMGMQTAAYEIKLPEMPLILYPVPTNLSDRSVDLIAVFKSNKILGWKVPAIQ